MNVTGKSERGVEEMHQALGFTSAMVTADAPEILRAGQNYSRAHT
jgi:hypothetical protein